jgi:hypothetical protein
VLVVSQTWTVMAKLLRKQGRLFLFLAELTLVIYSLRSRFTSNFVYKACFSGDVRS